MEIKGALYESVLATLIIDLDNSLSLETVNYIHEKTPYRFKMCICVPGKESGRRAIFNTNGYISQHRDFKLE